MHNFLCSTNKPPPNKNNICNIIPSSGRKCEGEVCQVIVRRYAGMEEAGGVQVRRWRETWQWRAVSPCHTHMPALLHGKLLYLCQYYWFNSQHINTLNKVHKSCIFKWFETCIGKGCCLKVSNCNVQEVHKDDFKNTCLVPNRRQS